MMIRHRFAVSERGRLFTKVGMAIGAKQRTETASPLGRIQLLRAIVSIDRFAIPAKGTQRLPSGAVCGVMILDT